VAGLSSDTPIVVFSHIPLFAMYPTWGWGTDDAAQVLNLLRRFASVTCLNGHVHQLFTKTEGNVTFHSATTTAYPLPHPGEGTVRRGDPAGRKAQGRVGIREVGYRTGAQPLAVKDVRSGMKPNLAVAQSYLKAAFVPLRYAKAPFRARAAQCSA